MQLSTNLSERRIEKPQKETIKDILEKNILVWVKNQG
jgi:hypothetical protein